MWPVSSWSMINDSNPKTNTKTRGRRKVPKKDVFTIKDKDHLKEVLLELGDVASQEDFTGFTDELSTKMQVVETWCENHYEELSDNMTVPCSKKMLCVFNVKSTKEITIEKFRNQIVLKNMKGGLRRSTDRRSKERLSGEERLSGDEFDAGFQQM